MPAISTAVALAVLVAGAPPLDGDGLYVHLLTLEPDALVYPGRAEAALRFRAWGLTPAGELLIAGSGDLVVVEPSGRLDRERYRKTETYVWASDNLVVDDGGVWYCDNRLGLSRLATDTGEVTHRGGWESPLVSGCGLMRTGGGGWFAWLGRLTSTMYELDAEGRIVDQGQLPAHVVYDHQPPLSLAPCGATAAGTPLAVQTDETFQRLRLVELDANLFAKKVLWEIAPPGRLEQPALAGAKAWIPDACTWAAGLVTLAYYQQIFVYDAEGRLLSAMRNGAPLDGVAAPTLGSGGYAFDMPSWAGPLGDGATFAVIEGYHNRLKLYARREATEATVAAAKEHRAAGRFARAHATWTRWLEKHPDDAAAIVDRAESLVAAGWWEEAIKEWKRQAKRVDAPTERRLFRLAVRARAQGLYRWTKRNIPGAERELFGEAPDPRLLAADYLAELRGAVVDLPDEPELFRAIAALAERSGHRFARLQALARWEDLLPPAERNAVANPELFALYAHRGDLEKMRAAIAAAGGKGARRRWRVDLARAERRYDDALAELAGGESPTTLASRGQLLTDQGKLDEAVAAWTKALQGDLAEQAWAQAGLGVAYLRRGLVQLAVECFLKASSLEPDDPAHAANLALAYAALDQREQTQLVLQRALAAAPADPLLRFQAEGPPKKTTAPAGPLAAGAIAVMPFDVAGGSVQRVGLGNFMAAMLVTLLSERPGLTVVERARLEELLGEQRFQASQYVDPDTAVRLGKLLGAERLVLGNVAEFADRVVLDVRVVEVASGRVLGAASGDAALGVEAIRGALAALAGKALPR